MLQDETTVVAEAELAEAPVERELTPEELLRAHYEGESGRMYIKFLWGDSRNGMYYRVNWYEKAPGSSMVVCDRIRKAVYVLVKDGRVYDRTA